MTAVPALIATALLAVAALACGSRSNPPPDANSADVGAAHCRPPYSASSPWNVQIGPSPTYGRPDAIRKAAIGTISSDPTQYTFPVYEVDSRARRQPVRLAGWYSDVSAEGRRLRTSRNATVNIPIPDDAVPAAGSDAQVVVVDRETGDEWGIWRAERTEDGTWRGENAYHYNVDWEGVPPRSRGGRPFLSRGAGVPYLAGLVRPCELRQGRIEHALAFAYDHASPRHVFPATKSDGNGTVARDLPEGARLQLDPALSERDIEAWGCTGPCLVIARALQRYGMYVIDNAGRPKIMLEYEGTARWDGLVTSETVSPIPDSAFKLVASCTRVGTPGDDRVRGTPRRDIICGRDGNDRLVGGRGDDVLHGGGGDDVLQGGSGADRLDGESGSDRLHPGRGRDLVIGGLGRDAVDAADGERDRLFGHRSDDSVRLDQGLDTFESPGQ
jgi:RTX calcium-binding nonapeptide repeat (4 copies)